MHFARPANLILSADLARIGPIYTEARLDAALGLIEAVSPGAPTGHTLRPTPSAMWTCRLVPVSPPAG